MKAKFWHTNDERPVDGCGPWLILYAPGKISTSEIYDWDEERGEFYGNIHHHIPLEETFGWISLEELEDIMEYGN